MYIYVCEKDIFLLGNQLSQHFFVFFLFKNAKNRFLIFNFWPFISYHMAISQKLDVTEKIRRHKKHSRI